MDNEYQELNITQGTTIIPIENAKWRDERGHQSSYIYMEEEVYHKNGQLNYKNSYAHTITSKEDTCYVIKIDKKTGEETVYGYWVKI